MAMAEWDDLGVTADPGRVHTEGRMVRAILEDARDQVATLFGVRPRQVIFTSGGSEAVNAAIAGARPERDGPMALADVEHSSVRLASARAGEVVTIPVDSFGRITPEAVEATLERCEAEFGTTPAVLHCQWANHEVGTIQPVEAVVDLCAQRAVPVQVDATAAAGQIPLQLGTVGALGVEAVSVSAHRFGGPVGIGALIVGPGVRLDPFILGGEQERGRRAGLENIRAAVGFAAVATALSDAGRIADESATARTRTDALVAAALSVPGVVAFGDRDDCLPNLVCLGIDGVEAEPVLLGLDQAGIAAHSGSSCSSETLEPSPVLEAMGVDGERSLRLSVGWSSTDDDVAAFAGAFPGVVAGLRSLRA